MGEAGSAIIAVDIGNSRTKIGCFTPQVTTGLPQPLATFEFSPETWNVQAANQWLRQHAAGEHAWWISSVNRPAAARLLQWIERHDRGAPVTTLTYQALPLQVMVANPERVGLDRLAGAVAANVLRSADQPAIVVDVGSAIKVHLVSADGAFRGGAILPGIAMSARAMHDFTDLLPLVPMSELTMPPPALGTSTDSAMRSGLYWGAVGAMRQLIARMHSGDQPAQVYLTGGAAPAVAELSGSDVLHVPHLVLSGIALAATSSQS